MAVKDFKEFGESAKGLSSEAREATELAWFALGYPSGDRRRDLREAVYARVLREFAEAVGVAEREELMRLASSPSGGDLVFGLIELLELRAAAG